MNRQIGFDDHPRTHTPLAIIIPVTNKQREGAASVSRTKRTLLLLANFGPFIAIVCTAFIAYGMEKRGVGPDVIGKVPQVSHRKAQACWASA